VNGGTASGSVAPYTLLSGPTNGTNGISSNNIGRLTIATDYTVSDGEFDNIFILKIVNDSIATQNLYYISLIFESYSLNDAIGMY